MQISKIGLSARDVAIKGMDYLVKAIGSTLGPFGSNILIEKGNRVTNDGFTVSTQVSTAIEDEFERRGALAIHEACSKTNDQVGDATTTAAILAQGIVKEAIKFLPKDGSFVSKKKPSEIIEQIKKEKNEVIDKLSKSVKMIESEKELIDSAKVSVEDDELADLIGKAQWEIGKDGVIIAEETAEYKSDIERVKGIRFDNGLGTTFVVNNPEKGTLEAKDCQVIMTNYVFTTLKPIVTLLEAIVSQGKKEIILIGRGYSSNAIEECKQNYDRGFHIYPINAPYTNQKEIMKDLEAITGGRYVDTEEGTVEEIGIQDLGFVKNIVAQRYSAVIAGNEDVLTLDRVQKRVDTLQKELKGEKSEFGKKMLNERISQLTNGFAILKVGAETDIERKRKKDKADDAVNAVRLALQGGTVKGGGLAFKEIADEMDDTSILKRPLQSIYNQIMSSSPEGFKIEEWVRDPYLVLKSALENACSVAGTFATISGIVCSANPKTCSCNNKLEHEEEQ